MKFGCSSKTFTKKFTEPTTYQSKISYGFVCLFIVLVLFGLFFVYLNRNEHGFLERFFPLIFTLYGVLMLVKYFNTKYIINLQTLDVYSGYKKYSIRYCDITEMKRRRINMLFRHGAKGRIRTETSAWTLFITFNDAECRKQVIIISPKNYDTFIKHFAYKMKEKMYIVSYTLKCFI